METSKKNKYPIWYYSILIIIPIVIILTIEILLRIINYGNDYSTFIKISDQFSEYLFFNPKLPQKYFGKSLAIPSVIPDGFKKNKPINTFRLFTIGGSTTAGFPYPPNGSFPRYLRRELERRYPSIDFEVINLGVSAINSITLRDIIGDILKQKPNLILIYAGHNEYYGALGPASVNRLFQNQKIISLFLYLKTTRIFQFVENLITSVTHLFNSNGSEVLTTLMAEMASDNSVDFGSSIYNAGLKQFEENLDYILTEASLHNIPTIIGTLTSNLMQQPLCSYAGCDSLKNEFIRIISDTTINKVVKKFQLLEIKEKDFLRFRAPEEINKIILKIAKKHNTPVAHLNKLFENLSPENIVGYNLIIDHLHPNLEGNSLIANEFLKLINIGSLLNDKITNRRQLNIFSTLDGMVPLTKIDSSFTEFSLEFLTSYFPFKNNDLNNFSWDGVLLADYADSLALQIVLKKIGWEDAHLLMADKCLNENRYDDYLKEINVLIEDKPFYILPYLRAIKQLDDRKMYDYSHQILLKLFDRFPDFYTSKRLANMFYDKKDFKKTYFFLNESLKFNTPDAEIYFKLSSIYFEFRDYKNALSYIKKCLDLNPKYPNAENIYKILSRKI
jgi:lysophospholipase L1-like esterase